MRSFPKGRAHDYPEEKEKALLKELFYIIEHLCLDNKAMVTYYPKIKKIHDQLLEDFDA
jgi:hypothetical protein